MRRVCVIGLGYVGLQVALAFGKKQAVIAFDKNIQRVKELSVSNDSTREVGPGDINLDNIQFTNHIPDIKNADFYIIAVPTPVDENMSPDLFCVLSASQVVGEYLEPNDIVVYESTVYPGATEEKCIPILEKYSDLKSNQDFHVGYSPERINPGDKLHCFANITKIVSAQSEKSLQVVAETYQSILNKPVAKAKNIKVAEAAKVIENTQRDINIAFMNELAMMFHSMGINISDVLEMAKTKWNFLDFSPGLVGGHCIGVDPYYLAHKSELSGYYPELILASRRINNYLPEYIASQVIKLMTTADLSVTNTRISVLGFSFKENCADIRNTKIHYLIKELESYGCNMAVYDPVVNYEQVMSQYNIQLDNLKSIQNTEIIILAVKHDQFAELVTAEYLQKNFTKLRIIIDIPNFIDDKIEDLGIKLWRL